MLSTHRGQFFCGALSETRQSLGQQIPVCLFPRETCCEGPFGVVASDAESVAEWPAVPLLPKATMEHQIACTCGNVLPLSEGMAGSTLICTCGRTVLVPSPSEPPAQAIMTDLP